MLLAIRHQIGLVILAALAQNVAHAASASDASPADRMYLIDQDHKVVRSDFGLCWHTSYGPPPSPAEGCGGPVAAAQAAQAAPATASVPLVVALAKPTAPVHVVLNADMLFDFDKATIRPAGHVALDAFVEQIKGINPEMIMGVGYADRFGSEAYNQRLSEERVDAVKGYLVTKGIAADRIHTEGRGKTEPVTKAGECEGAKSAAVIACLQPDRRVEVDVQGNAVVK